MMKLEDHSENYNTAFGKDIISASTLPALVHKDIDDGTENDQTDPGLIK
jgi:hypothetical protein